MQATVRDLIHHWAAQRPETPAVIDPGRREVTYRELAVISERIGEDLRARGVRRGDRVAIMLPPSAEAVIWVLAASCWATAAAVHVDAGQDDLAVIATLMRPSVVVTTASHRSRATALDAPVAILGGDWMIAGGPSAGAANDPAMPGDVAVILTTSGSTGVPKLVQRTHRNVLPDTPIEIAAFGLAAGDATVVSAQPFHSIGIAAYFLSLTIGGTLVIPRRADPAHVLDVVRRYRPAMVRGTPLLYQQMLRARRDGGADGHLKGIVTAGAHASRQQLAEMAEVFGAPAMNIYGMSEAWKMATEVVRPGEDAADLAPGLTVSPGVEIAIADEGGSHLPPGGAGEVVTRGTHVFAGYLGAEDLTAAVIDGDGWMHTGDAGVLDEKGRLQLVGRISDLVNRGGEKIAPVLVEEVLALHDTVAEAVVFGVPHETLGENLVAAVVLREGEAADLRELRRHLLDHLAASQVPRTIRVVPRLPQTASGKISRKDLAAWHAEGYPER